MESLFNLTQKIALPFLRLSMGVVLFWIGILKFADPSPVVGLLQASFSFLAFDTFVYVLGAVEVLAALLLFVGIGIRYVGFLLMGLFAGTLTIFAITPQVVYGNGFPYLSLAGEFLLKDLVLFAASVALVGMETARETQVEMQRPSVRRMAA
ncbi:MAG: DUF417 family protein [Nitrospira sp.]|nr:DUF417 family protein [Nitrospira sp.]